jgi:hypothetical protein
VLVVLISDQRFVEEADPIEEVASPASEGDGVYGPFIIYVVEAGASTGIWRVIGCRYGLLHVTVGCGLGRAAYIICAACFQYIQALNYVIRGIACVDVQPDDYFACRNCYGAVQASGCDLLRIVYYADG